MKPGECLSQASDEQLRLIITALQDADRRKDEFLATLAHELRNPLAPLRSALYILGLQPDAAAQSQARAIMDRQLTQLTRLVDDLMDVSRIARGRLEIRKTRVSLKDVMHHAVEANRPYLAELGHALNLSLPSHPIYLHADPARLAQVFGNLLTNAAKYTQPGGRITMTAERVGGGIAIAVVDTGIGISAEQLPRVFDMFSQLDGSRERSRGGLGIGLALVERLVEMHGGTVEAHSAGPGKGASFVVRLAVLADLPSARQSS